MHKSRWLGLRPVWQYTSKQSLVLPIGLLFAIAILLISPIDEFPLNVDWIYAKSVEQLLQTGQYRAHPYINATLVAQTFWGAWVCQLLGFSFTHLHLSTLVLALINA